MATPPGNGAWSVIVAGTRQSRASFRGTSNTYPKEPLWLCLNSQVSEQLVNNTDEPRGRSPASTTTLGSEAAAQTWKHTI
jgi:hypothetical protein